MNIPSSLPASANSPAASIRSQRGHVRFLQGPHTLPTIETAERIGANVIHTMLTGTYGRRHEQWKWRQIKAFADRCHEKGIKVSVYMKATSIAWQSFYVERPEARDWIMLCGDGKPAIYSDQPTRHMGCLNNTSWREYLREMIGVAIDHGADWLHFDNYFVPRGGSDPSRWACYCPTCRDHFALFTEEHMGWRCAMPREVDWQDPLWQLFIRFRDWTLLDFTRFLITEAHQIDTNVLIYPNLAPPWWSGGGSKGGCSELIVPELELLMYEGSPHPHLDFSQSRLAVLPRPVNTLVDQLYLADLYDGATMMDYHHRPKMTHDILKLGIAESHSLGNFYLLSCDPPYASDTESNAVIRRYYTFFKENEWIYHNVQRAGEVGVLICQSTNNWYVPWLQSKASGGKSGPVIEEPSGGSEVDTVQAGVGRPCSIQGLTQAMVENHIAFRVISDRKLPTVLSELRLLVLPDVACLSENHVGSIRRFVEAGGHLLATGRTSLFDERLHMRNDYALTDVFGLHYGQRADPLVTNTYGKGKVALLSFKPEEIFWRGRSPAALAQVEQALAFVLSTPREVIIDAPPTTGVHLARIGRTHTVMHLLNYDNQESGARCDAGDYGSGAPFRSFEVGLRIPNGVAPKSVTLLSPDLDGPVELEPDLRQTHCHVELAKLEIYNAIVFEWSQSSASEGR